VKIRFQPRRRVVALLASGGLLAAGLVTVAGGPVGAAGCGNYPFRNPNLPLSQRVSDLLGRLTTAQKIS